MAQSLAGDEHGRKVPPRPKGDRVKAAVEFGSRVRKVRLEHGWSQERLAEEADLNVIQLSNIERGANEPKLTTIIRLAAALGVRSGKLIGDSDAQRLARLAQFEHGRNCLSNLFVERFKGSKVDGVRVILEMAALKAAVCSHGVRTR